MNHKNTDPAAKRSAPAVIIRILVLLKGITTCSVSLFSIRCSTSGLRSGGTDSAAGPSFGNNAKSVTKLVRFPSASYPQNEEYPPSPQPEENAIKFASVRPSNLTSAQPAMPGYFPK